MPALAAREAEACMLRESASSCCARVIAVTVRHDAWQQCLRVCRALQSRLPEAPNSTLETSSSQAHRPSRAQTALTRSAAPVRTQAHGGDGGRGRHAAHLGHRDRHAAHRGQADGGPAGPRGRDRVRVRRRRRAARRRPVQRRAAAVGRQRCVEPCSTCLAGMACQCQHWPLVKQPFYFFR